MKAFSVLRTLLGLCSATLTYAVIITGAGGGVDSETGQRPFRQEISTFKDSGPAFDLFLLSLQQFQQTNQSALLSYYQIAGIHGHPFIEWDGVEGLYQAGYCTHISILFPSWHRPYMALFEQIIWTNAQSIAATYPASRRDSYQAAALTLRVPYWDWAQNVTMPDPVNEPLVSVNTPQGEMIMSNPLYNYTFHPLPSAPDFPASSALSKYTSTVRYPDANGRSQPELVNEQLQANTALFRDMTYQLLASQPDYAPFSNTGYTDSRGESYNSVEEMHDGIHTIVGTGGHMGIIQFAAFDPIFWLHHANVDRLLAIWQAIYPDSYTTSEVNIEGTFTLAPGSTDTLTTSLTPFHSDILGTFHTSATVRSTRTFGYTYPEIIDWGGVNATQLSSTVRANVNRLYNPTGSISTRALRPRSSNQTHSYPNTTSAETMTDWHYYVNIRLHKSALSTPFFVHFFLGTPAPSPSIWPTAPNLIATHSVLHARQPHSGPFNATITTNTTHHLAYGQIPLTHALRPLLPSTPLTPDLVLPLLKAQLEWRVQRVDGSVVSAGDVRGLRIGVVGREACEVEGGDEGVGGRGDRFPVFGPWRTFEGVGFGGES